MKELFLSLVRLGVGTVNGSRLMVLGSGSVDWSALKALAERQGLSAVVLDGIDRVQEFKGLRVQDSIPQMLRLEWIGEVLQGENTYAKQSKTAGDLASLFHFNYIKTYVLKGAVIAECYPRANHRVSADMDCYLMPVKGSFDAWDLGNQLVAAKGYGVSTSFYKNSSFYLPGLTVENHRFMTPFRGNKRMEKFERLLQSMMHSEELNAKDDVMEGTYLYRPPVLVTALFIVEHAYSHFLHEGLTWRMVLDWVLFSRKHKTEIDWAEFDKRVDEFGFRKFYDSYHRLGQYLIGEFQEFSSLSVQDKRMLADIWAPLDLHETTEGVKGKKALAGNTWRARWKYRLFTDMNWIQALWIQAKGVLFIKKPIL